jgi:Ser/Thr protein kinase RdoA (MazF antagonist)
MNTFKGCRLPIYNISAVENAVYLFSGEEGEVVLKFLL